MKPQAQANGGADFGDISAHAPDLDALGEQYRDLESAWKRAQSAQARFEVFQRWDDIRRGLRTWQSLTRLRFDQNTRDRAAKEAREQMDRVTPKLTAFDTAMKRLVLASSSRSDLEPRLGHHVFALWTADVSTFSPQIEADLTREAQLEAHYVELIAGAELTFDGRQVNLAGIEPYTQSPDRDVRYQALQTKWAFFSAHGAELDSLFGELVQLRTKMARTLGFASFTEMAYRRMNRVDYGQAEVERYRDQVAREIVPVAADVIARRAKRLGIAKPMFWDEAIVYPSGNPSPQGDAQWLVGQAAEVFTLVDPALGHFYRMLTQRHLLDLLNRDGKAGGGYCTSFPSYGVPFIFANFNGTHGDVHVLVHEMGHAFADWASRDKPVYDYLSPTAEAAEVHSMSMEYLTAPFIDRFFGKAAADYRLQQLEDAMLFLPYGVAIDHFQHLVYENPEATSAQRHRMWQQMEARYLHWRRYGDLSYPAAGGLWQAKGHVYLTPFYYIDYTLALCCALQFWLKSRADFRAAVADYVALCGRGGEAAFTDLIRSAGLRSPFEEDSLQAVAGQVRGALLAS